MAKWSIILLIFFSSIHTMAVAQNMNASSQNGSGSNSSRFFLGGNFGLQFGTVTAIDISPLLGYYLTERWAVGTGFIYQYYHNNPAKTSINMTGGRLFTRYLITETIFAHGEYELLSGKVKNDLGDLQRFTSEGMYLGGGLRMPTGGNSYFTMMALYNMLDGQYARENPVFRIGFDIGL
ncbi:MAG: hypothetical protein KDD36_12210 [Flavobacteriales bacterium]|nr:hypothetical protein [Flavobacteriales bacterium]